MKSRIDVLAFAPHPDDAELGCAGTLLRLKQSGRTIGIVDLTQGELSTRGTEDTRKTETQNASQILGLDARVNLGIPDGNIRNTEEHRAAIITIVRDFRPQTVLLPFHRDRHPDHEHAHILIRDAVFYSGLEKIRTTHDGTQQEAFRPKNMFSYMLSFDFEPAFIIDVSDTFETKLRAIQAYRTQFHSTEADASQPETYVSSAAYLEAFIARARRLGFLIGKKYGEGFATHQVLNLAPEALFN